jgi:hypothetical protein
MGSLFGGDDSGEQIQQTNRIELSPQQQQISNLAFPFAQQFGSTPLQLPEGSGIAGFTPAELQAQQGALNVAQGDQLGSTAAASLGNILSPGFLSPESNPFLAAQGQAVTEATTENLLRNILPALRTGASVAGGPFSGGSSREGIAQGLAAQGTSAEIARALAGLQAQNFQTGLQAQGQAFGQLPTVQAAGLFGPGVQGAVGAQQRGLEQAQLSEQQQRQTLEQLLPLLQSQQLFGLLAGTPGATGVTSVQGAQPSGPGLLQAGLGGASVGGSVGGVPGAFIGGGLGLLGSLLG